MSIVAKLRNPALEKDNEKLRVINLRKSQKSEGLCYGLNVCVSPTLQIYILKH